MDKVTFKCIGGTFNANPDNPKDLCTSTWNIPKYIEWLPKNSPKQSDFFLYVDDFLEIGLKNDDIKYGWVFESRPYVQSYINHILQNFNLYKQNYKYIFTHFVDLVELGEPFVYSLCPSQPRTRPHKRKIYEKTKLASMIVSINSRLPGHTKRLSYMEKYKHCMDVYGTGRPTEVIDIDDAVRDYMFSVGMENVEAEVYFSDKLTEAMANGAVPVYCGSKMAVEQYFDPKGVLWTDKTNMETDISEELYYELMPHIKNNFDIVCNDLISAEDYIYENFLSKE